MHPSARLVGLGLVVGVTSLLAGCESGRRPPPRYYSPYAQSGYGQPQSQQGLPTRTGTVGSAYTAFGTLFDQLPRIAFPLPPLPSNGNGSTGGTTQGGGFPMPWGNGQFPFPFPSPQPEPQPTDGWAPQWTAWEDEVLARTNDTRARGVVCGGQNMPPAPPVAANGQLRTAARNHSRDMATRNYFEHENPEGMGPMKRANNAGFQSTFVGENIAAGQPSPASVVQAWIDSPGHCVNMMDPRYKVLGVGYYFDGSTNDRFEHYWTQDFGG